MQHLVVSLLEQNESPRKEAEADASYSPWDQLQLWSKLNRFVGRFIKHTGGKFEKKVGGWVAGG